MGASGYGKAVMLNMYLITHNIKKIVAKSLKKSYDI